MSNGNGHRWSKFWWRDHQGDAALRACSLAARGYWMELLCIAHEAEQVGYVLLNGKQPTERQIAIIAGCSEREARKLEAELEDAGVFSRLPDGTIYSRRMVKDAEVAEAGREHIAKRWNGAKPPDPPNRVPIRVATSQPNSQASRSPGRDPIFPPDPPYPEAEEEPEEEERVSNRSNLPSFSPVLARVAAACETPPSGTFGAEPDEEPVSNARQIEAQNLLGKVVRKLDCRNTISQPIGRRPKLTVVEQIDAVLHGPVLDDAALEGEILEPSIRRGPVDPQRTVAEQLAALGFPEMAMQHAEAAP
jgi:hypothetical protein